MTQLLTVRSALGSYAGPRSESPAQHHPLGVSRDRVRRIMTGMVRHLGLLSCLLLSLSAEEPADELARALVNISQGVSRPADGLGVGPQDLPVEFDIVDRHTQTDLWWPNILNDATPDVRTLSAEKIILHGTAEERLAVIEHCLFDGRSFSCRSGCIVSSAAVGDRVLANGWGDLTDRQHWQLIATWLAQLDQDENWNSGCSWRELGAPVRSAGFLQALQPWCTGTRPRRSGRPKVLCPSPP